MSVTSGTKTESGLGETIRVVIHALLIALVIRTFLFQPFNIPSGSMKATLLVGDYLFVSKYSYGYSHYSIPLSPPLFSGRIFGSEPERGDIVVFRLPKDDTTDYIKRVIGLPGDRIQMKDGLLYINDKPVERERLSDFVGEDPCGSDATARVKRWKETLPNGVSYETLDCVDNGFYDNTNVYTVPPGHFFMMGDNRDNSTDSRVLSAVGYVPFENIDRPRPDDLLLDRRGRACLDVLALAVCGALESSVQNRAMNDDTADIQHRSSVRRREAQQPDACARSRRCEEARKRSQAPRPPRRRPRRSRRASGTNSPIRPAGDGDHPCLGAEVRAQARRQLSAAGISRRPRARADRLRHALPQPFRTPTRASCRSGLPISCARKAAPTSPNRSGLPTTSSSARSAPAPVRACANPCSATSARR